MVASKKKGAFADGKSDSGGVGKLLDSRFHSTGGVAATTPADLSCTESTPDNNLVEGVASDSGLGRVCAEKVRCAWNLSLWEWGKLGRGYRVGWMVF